MAISIVLSAVNALTLSPALCAIFLKPHSHEEKKQNFIQRFFTNFNIIFDAFVKRYSRGVLFLLRKKWMAFAGLVVFAGDAYTQLPITSDFVSAKMFLNTINPNMVPTQGTAIGRAISTAMNSFTPNEGVDKAIIVITDAENHEDDAVQMAKAAAEKNIKVDVIGIGSLEGVPIPTGNSENNFIKDRDGNVVISKLNESLGQEIAKAGTGIYVRADNTNSALRALTSEVKKIKKADIESKVYSQYDEQFQGLAWIALLLLIVDVFIVDRKNSWLKKITFFS